MATEYNHQVFMNDPIRFSNLIGKYVMVLTKYNTSLKGFVSAIDPVSESLIISQVTRQSDETFVILGHSIESIKAEEPPDDTTPRVIATSPEITNQPETIMRKVKVQNWLFKNLLPIEDINGVLHVHGGNVCIMPPYKASDCISSNAIVLGRIQHLLQRMPE